MTVEEFSNEFDVLYNNIASNKAPGINEYEKSVLLTKAQSEIIKNYFNPKGNKYQEGFDQSQKRQMDFSSLIKTVKVANEGEFSAPILLPNEKGYRSVQVQFSTFFVIINETVTVTQGNKTKTLQCVPIKYNEYLRVASTPYKHPLKNQAWRLLVGKNVIDLAYGPNNTITAYTVRYVAYPKPIILEDLPNGLSIQGETKSMTSELPEGLHQEILQRAVELAKSAYLGDLKSEVELGQRSE